MEEMIVYLLLPIVFAGVAVFGSQIAGRVFITKMVEAMSQKRRKEQ